MDSSTWMGYQDNILRPAASAFTVAEHGAQACTQRSVPGYTHQVFAEMPTSSSEHRTHVIAPGYWNYYYGHQNPILNSCSQSDSTNPPEHYLAGMPQPYGFHNLNRQSLFLADGTEHSYYALPENYSFERTTSSTSPAMPTVEVRSSCQSFILLMNCIVAEKQTHPGQETLSIPDMLAQLKAKLETIIENYENRKHSHERTLLCIEEKVAAVTNLPSQDPREQELLAKETSTYFIQASENVIPSQQPPMSATATDQMQFQAFESIPNYDVYEKEDSACLNTILHERDFTLELQQQDDERACNCPVLKPSDSLVTKSSQLSVDHSMSKLRLLWDPGTSTSLHSTMRLVDLLYYSQAHEVENRETVQWDPGIRPSSSMYCWLHSLTAGAVTGQPLSSLQTPEPATSQSQVTSASYVWDPGTILLLSKSIWLLLFTQEKEVVALIPEKWSFLCNAMHYCKIFQRCAAINSLFHCHGIPLWLINFQVP